MAQTKSHLIVISGERNAGKSYFCAEIVKAAKKTGLDVAGILSPTVEQNGMRTRIDAQDIRTGVRKTLAYAKAFTGDGTVTDHWRFDERILSWGNEAITKAAPCDIFVFDEIGPLEFNLGKGWIAGMLALEERRYRYAFAVIRPDLVDEARQRWKVDGVISITERNRRWKICVWRLRMSLIRTFPWL